MPNPKYFNNSKSHAWAAKMIPIMVRWAKSSHNSPHYYSDLSGAIGLKTNQIGQILGNVQDIIQKVLANAGIKKEDRPTLNALIVSKLTNLPSESFDYCLPYYRSLSTESKQGELRKLNEVAYQYNWDWVLEELGLDPVPIYDTNDLSEIRNQIERQRYGKGGGEGQEHRSLKEYILEHPNAIGLEKKVAYKHVEEPLYSGDFIDVFFILNNSERVAVEVKPSSASENEVLRGIFQCVKYKAVLDAMRVIHYSNYSTRLILVLGGGLTNKNRQVVNDLGIEVIENFSVK